jgi:hypothetical protein
MAKKQHAYVPSMSDTAVEAKTGRDWPGWFEVLDEAGAAALNHSKIAALLSERYGVPSWWSQMVTVEYERARGLRARHETPTGFSVAVSKTLKTSLSQLFAAASNETRRRQWFPRGTFRASSQTKNKYLRGSWSAGARVEMGFSAKSEGKAQIAIQLSKLGRRADVERERAAWKQALGKLQVLVERVSRA